MERKGVDNISAERKGYAALKVFQERVKGVKEWKDREREKTSNTLLSLSLSTSFSFFPFLELVLLPRGSFIFVFHYGWLVSLLVRRLPILRPFFFIPLLALLLKHSCLPSSSLRSSDYLEEMSGEREKKNEGGEKNPSHSTVCVPNWPRCCCSCSASARCLGRSCRRRRGRAALCR